MGHSFTFNPTEPRLILVEHQPVKLMIQSNLPFAEIYAVDDNHAINTTTDKWHERSCMYPLRLWDEWVLRRAT